MRTLADKEFKDQEFSKTEDAEPEDMDKEIDAKYQKDEMKTVADDEKERSESISDDSAKFDKQEIDAKNQEDEMKTVTDDEKEGSESINDDLAIVDEKEEKAKPEEWAIYEYNENPKGNMYNYEKNSSSEALGVNESVPSKDIKILQKNFLLKWMSLTGQKITQNSMEPLSEIKPIGDQVALQSNKKDAIPNHSGQNFHDSSPPNMEGKSKSCTIL
ncbi:X-linked retinitis pigmentosa GTPase regulator [Heterocephalus glaber]|uniref:X-linked retinitis pigmentosa GTPase regulator n=1 Tax=Heterocephalus glaber TaxID=10181 RepID=G5BMQ7_HETGA|nr:X-linked retinitis pigmentosa GTPase regulator [Heterocephalus glaber]